jgi:hypothetical protein
LEDLWLIYGELVLLRYSTRGATVPWVLFTPRVVAAARVGGAQGTPAAGLRHGRQERRVFLLVSCLIRLIHLLSLNREDYLTPKQGLNLIPKPNPNGPPGPLGP